MVSVTQREDSWLFELHDSTQKECDEMADWLDNHVNGWQVALENGNAPLTVIIHDGSAALFKLRWYGIDAETDGQNENVPTSADMGGSLRDPACARTWLRRRR
jgi:hypothetical protein